MRPQCAHRYARATMPKSHFTKEQDAHLHSLLPALESCIEKHDPQLLGKNIKVTEWKKASAAKVLNHELFKDKLDTTEKTLADWETAIIRWFTNRNNYTFKLKPAKLALKAASSSATSRGTPTTLASAAAAVTSESNSASPDKAVSRVGSHLDRALQQLAAFTTELSPFDLFAFENDKEVTENYRAYAKETGIPGGGARKHILGEMWAKADKRLWEEKAQHMVNNIEANQEQFACIMKIALDGLAERGRIGSSIFNFYFAYRDKNDGLHSGVVYSGYDTTTNTPVVSKPPEAEELQDGWADYADQALPRTSPGRPATITFDRSEQQLPIFPRVKIRDTSARDMGNLINGYLVALWRHAVQTGAVTDAEVSPQALPWKELAEDPDRFYDTATYSLPTPLKSIDSCSPVDILLLATYFRELRRLKAHFMFRTTSIQPLFEPSSSPFISPASSPAKSPTTILPAPADVTNDDSSRQGGSISPSFKRPASPVTVANSQLPAQPCPLPKASSVTIDPVASKTSSAVNEDVPLQALTTTPASDGVIPPGTSATISNVGPGVSATVDVDMPSHIPLESTTISPSNGVIPPGTESANSNVALGVSATTDQRTPSHEAETSTSPNGEKPVSKKPSKKTRAKASSSSKILLPEQTPSEGRGKRKRQPVAFGPTTLVDPNQPPPKKRVKHSYYYEIVPV
ncbi:hypothetical protein FPV67DRAFT_1656395 [Lyophyllum atratum]|nr:hypothetical protein FPV67DRAFT_1656395 [Lyophyllum atratum]